MSISSLAFYEDLEKEKLTPNKKMEKETLEKTEDLLDGKSPVVDLPKARKHSLSFYGDFDKSPTGVPRKLKKRLNCLIALVTALVAIVIVGFVIFAIFFATMDGDSVTQQQMEKTAEELQGLMDTKIQDEKSETKDRIDESREALDGETKMDKEIEDTQTKLGGQLAILQANINKTALTTEEKIEALQGQLNKTSSIYRKMIKELQAELTVTRKETAEDSKNLKAELLESQAEGLDKVKTEMLNETKEMMQDLNNNIQLQTVEKIDDLKNDIQDQLAILKEQVNSTTTAVKDELSNSLAAEAERTEKKAADLKADLENLMAESANVWTNLLDVLKDMKEEQLETIRVKLEQNKVTIMEELEGLRDDKKKEALGLKTSGASVRLASVFLPAFCALLPVLGRV